MPAPFLAEHRRKRLVVPKYPVIRNSRELVSQIREQGAVEVYLFRAGPIIGKELLSSTIICWEHPNFADDILRLLDRKMGRRSVRFWPSRIPSIDANLVVSFIFRKR